MTWVVPLPSNSHHQGCYVFSRGSHPKPSFATATTGRGDNPNYDQLFFLKKTPIILSLLLVYDCDAPMCWPAYREYQDLSRFHCVLGGPRFFCWEFFLFVYIYILYIYIYNIMGEEYVNDDFYAYSYKIIR